ncbi:hypothetical protein TTHERM_00551110 (macronuclear) [Tetrahymena thermophila SB210]|uniref:Uncharacterized protein n=1 Tax=Tetrahymena thermophila (strain SB210) TaxID=312017 RepID=Q22UL7_TETTS|nr:hypothetical protein TTHERM_00551110 [Tetrahymena thermophila SB210]EAR88953.1 hypothetical protein TTHERM_00551110 [Tetrahymena thermophila SB210]|eukprot:XP_001009198.1 hypothetical protein TTHERM_00551110 [Tetrahymena thermophila SB210]
MISSFKDNISSTCSTQSIIIDQISKDESKSKVPSKKQKKISKQNTNQANENYDEKEQQEIERLRSLVSHYKKRECGVQILQDYVVSDEPVFILWGSCVLDLRLKRDLAYQKDACWSKFMKVDQFEIFNDKLSLSMTQYASPLKNMEHISSLLLRFNLKEFKELADAILAYQQVANFMVSQISNLKKEYQGKQIEFEQILADRQEQFEQLKSNIIKQEEEGGLPFIAITSGFNYTQDTTAFKNASISKSFLDLMGGTAEQYINISLRKGGLEFFQPLDQAKYIKAVLDLILSQQNKSYFEAKIKTYDNIDLFASIESEIFTIDNGQYSPFTGDNILTIQRIILNENQLKSLETIRKNQILNPLIEWEEDFAYSIQSEQLVEKFYLDQSKILKKMKKLNKIYKKKEEKKNFPNNEDNSKQPSINSFDSGTIN